MLLATPPSASEATCNVPLFNVVLPVYVLDEPVRLNKPAPDLTRVTPLPSITPLMAESDVLVIEIALPVASLMAPADIEAEVMVKPVSGADPPIAELITVAPLSTIARPKAPLTAPARMMPAPCKERSPLRVIAPL